MDSGDILTIACGIGKSSGAARILPESLSWWQAHHRAWHGDHRGWHGDNAQKHVHGCFSQAICSWFIHKEFVILHTSVSLPEGSSNSSGANRSISCVFGHELEVNPPCWETQIPLFVIPTISQYHTTSYNVSVDMYIYIYLFISCMHTSGYEILCIDIIIYIYPVHR